MRSSRLGIAVALILSLAGSVTAQQSVPSQESTESGGLRITWTVEPQTRDFTAVCGHIFNDQRVSARNVSLMVQSVDGDRVAMGAEVTVFSRSRSKEKDARALGAQHYIAGTDEQEMRTLANHFDLIMLF